MNKRLERTAKAVKAGDKNAIKEYTLLEKLRTVLESEKPVRSYNADAAELDLIKNFFLITSKPVIYCANVDEDQIKAQSTDPQILKVKEFATKDNAETVVICAKIEEELSHLDEEELEMFKEELGLSEFGLDQLIVASYRLLGLISYLTAGEPEVRAWTIKKGTKAPQAAGKIHTDFERGFIKAEVISYEELIAHGSMTSAKEKGKVRIEGKEYVVQDGDVMLFRFNV